MRKWIIVNVTSAERARIRAVVGNRNSPQKHVWRANIILLTDDGLGTNAIMRGTGRAKSAVWRWQERFMREGVHGLLRDKTRPPGRKPLDLSIIERVIALTAEDPPEETTHWTAGLMARTVGISVSSVQRIWQAHGLRPHRVRRCKLSKDPEFVPKTAQNRRPLRQPAGPRHCALGRREVADTGARSHPARVADEEGSRWYLDARLVWGVSRQSLNF